MAREIVTWCDPCMGRDERTPGREETIALNGKPRVIALCQADRDQLLKPLEAVLEEFGAPVEAPASGKVKVGGRVSALHSSPEKTLLDFSQSGNRKGRPPKDGRNAACPLCPLTYGSDTGLAKHLHNAHGVGEDARIRGAFGSTCPVCGNAYELIGGHVNKSHPDVADNIAQAFLWAKDNGDPHGAYAALVADATNVLS